MKLNATTKTLLSDSAESVQCAKKRHTTLYANRGAVTATIDLMNRMLARFDDQIASSVWSSCGVWNKTVALYVGLAVNATSMKVGIVPDVLKALVDYEFDATETTDCADEITAKREFRFVRPSSELFLRIVVTVNAVLVDAEDATCRKVQIGTKMLEVPQYQLLCDEASE